MTSYLLDLSRDDLIDLTLAVSAAAASSYCDDRLTAAASQYAIAARLWAVAGYPDKGAEKLRISLGIRREIIENAMEAE